MKNITIKYEINGAKFRRKFARIEYRAAKTRIAVLEENCIAVTVRGMPKRITL